MLRYLQDNGRELGSVTSFEHTVLDMRRVVVDDHDQTEVKTRAMGDLEARREKLSVIIANQFCERPALPKVQGLDALQSKPSKSDQRSAVVPFELGRR